MNLQINSPFTPCPYKCPYCCACYENGVSYFADNRIESFYHRNQRRYLSRLVDVIKKTNPTTIVITGSTEPTLFPEWMEKVLETIYHYTGFKGQVELATRNKNFYKYNYNVFFKVVAYSFHEIPDEVWIYESPFATTRSVFVLHKGLNIHDIISYAKQARELKPNYQVTVKNLATNSYDNAEVNKWIEENRVTLSPEEIEELRQHNIRYDHDCNNSAGRYAIFRADGCLYESWQSLVYLTEWEGKSLQMF